MPAIRTVTVRPTIGTVIVPTPSRPALDAYEKISDARPTWDILDEGLSHLLGTNTHFFFSIQATGWILKLLSRIPNMVY